MASKRTKKSGFKKDLPVGDTGVDRYKHDLEQARLMSKGSRSSQASADIELGLRGLEEAGRCKDQGDDITALKMYQSSIEILIRYLRATPSPTRSSQIANRDMVEERVRMALSEAERLKESTKPSTDGKMLTSLSPTSFWSSWASSAEKQPISSPHKSSSTGVVGRKATSSPPDKAAKRRATLDYNNDPYVKIVKSDLYVDASELEKTKWDDIAGLEKAKQSLQEACILPLLRPDLFTGLRKPQNVLLYGPPGTGKTMLVRAVASESSCLLFACTASALTSKWHGEGEKLVRTLFRLANDVAPSIIFIDEMDSLLSSRGDGEHEASRRFKTEFMVQMDGIVKGAGDAEDVHHRVLVLGCTNCPWDVDDAVLRRFPRRIHIPLPDSDSRRGLIIKLLEKAGKHNLTRRHVSTLVTWTDGYSCSDVCSLASDAAFGPLRSLSDLDAIRNVETQDVRPITIKDFENAKRNCLKSVSPVLLEKYKKWERQQAST